MVDWGKISMDKFVSGLFNLHWIQNKLIKLIKFNCTTDLHSIKNYLELVAVSYDLRIRAHCTPHTCRRPNHFVINFPK